MHLFSCAILRAHRDVADIKQSKHGAVAAFHLLPHFKAKEKHMQRRGHNK
jgi:23S rRNA maturation mini-RNase III